MYAAAQLVHEYLAPGGSSNQGTTPGGSDAYEQVKTMLADKKLPGHSKGAFGSRHVLIVAGDRAFSGE
jgi:hypothetical protein